MKTWAEWLLGLIGRALVWYPIAILRAILAGTRRRR